MFDLRQHMIKKGRTFFNNPSMPMPEFKSKDSEEAFWIGFWDASEEADSDIPNVNG